MIRYAKKLGLALVAVFALSAVAAAGASAQHTFTSEIEGGGTTYLTGTTEEGTIDKFTVGSILGTQTLECHAHFAGEGTFPANAECRHLQWPRVRHLNWPHPMPVVRLV